MVRNNDEIAVFVKWLERRTLGSFIWHVRSDGTVIRARFQGGDHGQAIIVPVTASHAPDTEVVAIESLYPTEEAAKASRPGV